MARSVYSTLFIAAFGTPVSAGYAVPAGFTAVVRDVVAVFTGTPNNTAIDVVDTATNSIIAYHLQLNPFEMFHWEGRQVVHEGATFTATSAGPTGVSVRVSGYLLALP
jgi:hypothetical protein